MTWFKVTDKLHSSPTWAALPDSARALYCTAGAWCGDQLTDGFVPVHVLPMLHSKKPAAVALSTVGGDESFWVAVDGGWRFRDWLVDQPSRAQVVARRTATADRVRQHRGRRVEQSNQPDGNAVTGPVTNGVTAALVTAPPSRPVPTRTEKHSETAGPAGFDPAEFDAFWEVFPRKDDKARARTAYVKARQSASADEIREGACRYAKDPGRDPSFTKMPTTWLNAEAWGNEPLPIRKLAAVNGSGRYEPRIFRGRAGQMASEE